MNIFYTRVTRIAGLVAIAAAAFNASAATVEAGALQVGTDLTYPPYNFFDDNKQPAGFDVEFMTALAKAAKLTPKFQDTRFENLILGVKSNKFDVIASTLYVKPERAQQITYVPYMKTGVSIAVKKDGKHLPVTPEQLCGKKVGNIKGGAWLADLKKLSETTCADKGGIDVREYPTSPEATQALLSGGVDAQMEDSAVLRNAVDKTGGRLMISSKVQLYPVIVGLGINPKNGDLVKVVENALESLRKDGQYQKLLTKYNVSAPTAAEFKAAVTSKAP